MIDYTTLIILIALTFIAAFISLRVPLVGIFVLLIDIFSLVDTLISANVIMGYGYELVGGAYQVLPIVENMPELRLIMLITMILCIGGTIAGFTK